MTIRGERATTRLLRVGGSSRLAHKRPIDASRVIVELDNNLAHLTEESVHHLVWDVGFKLPSTSLGNSSGWRDRNSSDVSLPSQDDVTHVWQQIAWDRRTARRYGPFVLVPDAGDRPVDARPRSVRVVAKCDIPSGFTVAGACAVMTRGSHPNEIFEGRYIAAAESPGLSAGAQTLEWDLVPDTAWTVDGAMRPNRTLPSAPTSMTSTTSTAYREYYLWVGWSVVSIGELSTEVFSVSAFERR